MAEIPLMALYWTVAGPVEIHAGREWSVFSWRERCETVARGGFQGMGCGTPTCRISARRPPSRRCARCSTTPA